MAGSFRKAALWVLVCGVVLRIVLALVNIEANDDHVSVIRIMAYENSIPELEEQFEAFQPKLYYATVAELLKLVRLQSRRLQTILAQLISCTAGIFTLLLGYRFLMNELEVSERVRFLSFSLLALNPGLIGINGQATNDSFVILFGSLAFYFGWHFFQNQRANDFCWMSVSAVLAGLSKGTGLVIFVAILAVFVMAFYRRGNSYHLPWSTTALYGFIFLVGYCALVPTLGPYWKHYRQYGSPFKINAPPDSWPHLFEKTLPASERPGVLSLADTLLTFRLVDMLKNPYTVNDEQENYPQHRTSLWSQLYGRTHFVHFDNWPRSWQLPIGGPDGGWPYGRWIRQLVFNIGRLILLCALLPTALMLTGLLRSLISAGRMFVATQASKRRLTDWLLDFTTVGYILFITVTCLRYRDFSFMKPIYIFPGFLAFLIPFARECNRFYTWGGQSKILRLSADTMFVMLLLLYVIDVTALIAQLSYINVVRHLLYPLLHRT